MPCLWWHHSGGMCIEMLCQELVKFSGFGSLVPLLVEEQSLSGR